MRWLFIRFFLGIDVAYAIIGVHMQYTFWREHQTANGKRFAVVVEALLVVAFFKEEASDATIEKAPIKQRHGCAVLQYMRIPKMVVHGTLLRGPVGHLLVQWCERFF